MARRLKPATWPWLFAHEARLMWRTAGGAHLVLVLGFCAVAMLLAHLVGWALMRHLDLEAMLRTRSTIVVWSGAILLLFILSMAFGLAVSAIFSRGDMDLLLSSPVPIRGIYTVRAISVALGSIALFSLLLLPIANMAAVLGRWRSLAGYPVLLSVGLLCAALAFAGTLGLARALGARRARVAAQVLGAVAGAFVVLASQFFNLMPKYTQDAVARWIKSDASAAWLGPNSLLTWPVRAFFGDPLPAVAMLALGFGGFALTMHLTAGSFASAAQESAVAASPRWRPGARRRGFRSGLARIVIAKELILIARDPMLIAKALLQVLYLVPMLMILVRRGDLAQVLAASLVVMASSVAGTFAWLTVSGEEVPDLLQSSPISRERMRWLKVCAALLPVGVLIVPFLAWYAWLSLRVFAIVAVFAAAGVASAAVIQVWTGKPSATRDLKARGRQNVLMNFVELFCSLGWAAACFLAISGYYRYIPAGVALGVAGPGAAWLVRQWRDRNELSAGA